MMSSTHIVEFGVREASLCADARRSESIRSAYALIRSVIAKSANRSVVSATKHLPKRANWHVSAGVKGQREVKSKIAQRKHGGSTEAPADKDIIQRTPRGAARATHLLMRTLDVMQQLPSSDPSGNMVKKNQAFFFTNCFAKKRKQCETATFEKKMDREVKKKKVDTSQATPIGVHVTDTSLNRIKIADIMAKTKGGLDALKGELDHRQIVYDPCLGFRAQDLLKQSLSVGLPDQIKSFEPQSAIMICYHEALSKVV